MNPNSLLNAESTTASAANELTVIQKERVNAIYHIYEDLSPFIVKLVNGRGVQSWKNFFNNALRVYKARGEENEYYTQLTHSFDVDEFYTIDEISRLVNEVRAELGLTPYIRRINAQCVDDFLTVFFVEEQYSLTSEGAKDKFKGYKILFPIKR